jgi:hypothetical protein
MSSLPLTANPSLLWLPVVAALAVLVGLLALLPALLLLASLIGVLDMAPTMDLTLLALPTAAVGLFFLVVALAIAADLRLPHPVLRIDGEGVFDRRVTDAPIRWADIVEAAMAPGGGAVQLALREPLDTRLSPYRAGTIGFRNGTPGIALIPVRGMDRPAALLADTMLAEVAARTAVAGAS